MKGGGREKHKGRGKVAGEEEAEQKDERGMVEWIIYYCIKIQKSECQIEEQRSILQKRK